MDSTQIIQELNVKKRKIRSLRGFLAYALEIIQNEKDVQILKTNFKPLFWTRLPNILRQNRNSVLLEFLFDSSGFPSTQNQHGSLEKKLQSLEDQINLLQDQIIHLNSTLPGKKKSSQNPSKGAGFKDSRLEMDNRTINENTHEYESNFVLFKSLTEEEQIDLIRTGFENQSNGLSLKEYYEGTNKNSLFDLKGYSLKYDTIRRSNLYKRLKNKNRDYYL